MAQQGVSYLDVVQQARSFGWVEVNQFDQHPRALKYRRAVYRAVNKGLLKRVRSQPSRARYIPTAERSETGTQGEGGK